MLTRAGLALLSTGLTLVLGGLVLGNPLLLVTSAFPLLVLLAGTTRRAADPEVTRTVTPQSCRAGDVVTVEITVAAPAGVLAVNVHQPLPTDLHLTEGENVHLVTGHPTRARRATFRFRVRAPRRGTYDLPPVRWETVNLLGLASPASGSAGDTVAVRVAPRLGGLARARAARLREGTEPGVGAARIGLSGTDFADLREYAIGDPPKSINWKATARRINAGTSNLPLVNEYEREGKRTVIILVDATRDLEAGTSLVTGLDHVLDAATGLARFLLGRGHRVGAVLVDAHGTNVEVPDTGPAHAHRIARVLEHAQPRERGDLEDAAARALPFLRGASPLVIAFTRVTDPAAPLVDAVRRFRAGLVARPGRRPPTVVVDVRPFNLAPVPDARADEARALMDALDAPAQDVVRRAGATIVAWDPAQESFAKVFLREVAP